ncbi:MAG TPA: SDR family NAD(P)-dependent oxidoreductase [Micromonosporaceae bacterium]|jgi:NAD(P)-dependent dehydrogenase (short-subunit alcohol dehydrogenase family)
MAFNVAITGGARGIGLATARAFAEAGAKVAIGDVDEAAAAAAAAQTGATAHVLDVRDRASFAAFISAVGLPDVLVNNAGVAHAGTFIETPDELRDLQIDVNLRGVANGMSAVLPAMVERGTGHVVNVASLAGRLALPHAATYTATKFAVVGLTEAVAAELHGSGVHVSAVLPTFVRTDMTDGIELGSIPVVEAADVARTILRIVRRGGPTLTTVPRWLAGLPRLAALTPQAVLEALRHASSGDPGSSASPASGAPFDEDRQRRRDAYLERIRGLLPPTG